MDTAMEMAQLERARALERKFDRRAARAKRSRWLGRLLFSLTGMALLLVVRMNPAIVSDVVAWSHGTSDQSQPGTISKPGDIRVRAMPGDKTPVRRGGSLPGNGKTAAQNDIQGQADDIGSTLRSLNPGG